MKTATITIRLTESDKIRVEEIAKERDIPVSQLIREAVKNIIQEVKK